MDHKKLCYENLMLYLGQKFFTNQHLGMTADMKIAVLKVSRVMNFTLSKDLVIMNSILEHQNSHKYTWTFPNGNTSNDIDHTLIYRGW
jgi:hypothetical protein